MATIAEEPVSVQVAKKPFYRSLYVQVLVAILIGILLGHFFPSTGERMQPLGDIFVKLIKMVIGPIIFSTVVVGISSVGDVKKVGRVGLKALFYFELVSSIALVVGLIVVNIIQPGKGVHADPTKIATHDVDKFIHAGKSQTAWDHLVHMIPSNIFDALAKGDILQILFFSVLFGIALAAMKEKGKPLVELIDKFAHVQFAVIGMIMKLAPIGAFGAMAFTVGKYKIAALVSLAKLMGCFYATCIVFIAFILGSVMRMIGLRILPFLRYIKDELIIVLGTSSSESVLPRMITKLEKLGCSSSVVGLVIPTGYSFNLDGTSIYLTMAVMYIAQATDTPLSISQQLGILAVLLLTSKGSAGVSGAGFITLAATLSTVGTVPVAGIALIFGIDRFMSEARALTNLIGNGVAGLVVSRWEKALDQKRAFDVLIRSHGSSHVPERTQDSQTP